MTFQENITIAILGPVSAGKSTFLNALCSNTYSDMLRRKTTMLPQIYHILNNSVNIDNIDEIYKKNKESNEKILELREEKKFDINRDFIEIHHNIEKINHFIVLPNNNTNYSILDMPGLNCGGDDIYYEYIRKNSNNIDIYLLLIDINSGLNTTDEINIIKLIVEQIKINSNGYMYVLINKCDDISFDDRYNVTLDDKELNDLYKRCNNIINEHCKDIIDKVIISPLCSSKLYIYRGVNNNITTIDESQLDNIIKNECGKKELKKLLTLDKKRKFISGLLNSNSSSLYNDWMKDTGYNQFETNINNIITVNYEIFILHHINIDILKILDLKDIDNITEQINIIKDRINLLKIKDLPEYIFTNLNKINDIIKTILNIDSSDCSLSLIDTLLIKMDKYNNIIKGLFKKHQFVDTDEVLKTRREKLLINEFQIEYKYGIFLELFNKNLLTENIFINSIVTIFNQKDVRILCDAMKKIKFISDEYLNILLESLYGNLVKGEYKIVFIDFIKLFEEILNYKVNDIKYINNFLLYYIKHLFLYEDIPKTFEYMYYENLSICSFWLNLNMHNIKLNNTKIQLIFMNISTMFQRLISKNIENVSLNCSLEHITTITNTYEGINNRMDEIYFLIVSYLDTVTKKPIISIIPKIDSVVPDDSKVIKNTKVDTKVDTKVNGDDDEYEKHSESDSSDIVYKKATKNAAKRTIKIVKNAEILI